MRDSVIDERIALLKADAALRGGLMQVKQGPGASQADLSKCEDALGQRLPRELVSFLQIRNGLSLFYYEEASTAVAMPDAWSARFEIQGTTGIAILTLSWRDFLADAIAASSALSKMQARANEIVILANQSDIITYVKPDHGEAEQACPVRDFDQEQYDSWLDSPEKAPIAPSITEHVVRAIDTMMRTYDTFLYWD